MEARQSRKRRTSSVSNREPRSPALRRSTRQSATNSPAHECKTPQHPKKKVRFSDPGPQLHNNGSDFSTGLTPSLMRTSFEEAADSDHAVDIPQTPSARRQRRRSTPLRRSRVSLDPLWPSTLASPERVVQFTPLRQILDSRTQRRIKRVGLSDEINQLEREKREAVQYEKTLQSLLRERNALRHELDLARNSQGPPSPASGEEMMWNMPPRAQIEDLERENSKLREELSFSSMPSTEADTVIINDSTWETSTVLVSNSPDMRGMSGRQAPTPEDLCLMDHEEGSTIVVDDFQGQDHPAAQSNDAEAVSLSADLEAARKEKKELFNAWRSRLSLFTGTPLETHLRRSSPPPDFLDQILPTLTAALTRATDAAGALHSVEQELSSLGFPGENADEILAQMRERFRWARLQLERALPGETPNGGLHDGNNTLSALGARVELLVRSLDEEQKLHEAAVDRERVLRGNFNSALERYEAAAQKVRDLEESITSSARDMLHTRMRMQELESEGREQAIGIERLNAALGTYREEVTNLEKLVTELEQSHGEQMSRLQDRVAGEEKARQAAESTVAERDTRIHELEASVENNRISVCDLTAKVELLEKERQNAVDDMQRQTTEQIQLHQQEIGLMNVRVSDLTTSLEAARSEAEKLRVSNVGLEEQLQLEMQARDSLLARWEADQARSFAYMKEMVNTERRKAKVRSANWQMKSDDLQSDEINVGSEPITPVSMTRFVDVEVGRGKHRRRLDSGIGILTDDLLEENEVEPNDGEIPPSDPADL